MRELHTSRTRRTLGSYVSPHALAFGTRSALETLGYALVPASSWGPGGDPAWKVDLCLADARPLGRLPVDEVPLILLGSGSGPVPEDTRVAGRVRRPADVAALYPLLQRSLETHPRRAARAAVSIPARGARADRRWSGEVLRLSQAGCLFRTPSDLLAGLELNLSFPLPLGRMVSIRARVSSHTPDGAGLDFLRISAPARDAIGEYVQRTLAAPSANRCSTHSPLAAPDRLNDF